MKKIFIIFILFTFISVLAAENTSVTNIESYKVPEKGRQLKEVEKYLKQRDEAAKDLARKRKPESPLRRFEIQFFTSAPIVYLSTLFILKIYQEAIVGTSSELPDVQWYFIGVNSIGIATYIAIKDYYDNKQEYHKAEKDSPNSYKLTFLQARF
ncbi:MAG: hypothetical protein JW827_02555 [Spirochaetes bacterium]|nr:hypothetical protein [Spirochaetota bacterium]